jgi:23S rRNA (adenine2503-C2)-methyltransferase
MPTPLLGLNTDELRALAQQQGEPAYRGHQLAEWIYRRGVRAFDQMTNLPKALRMRLEEGYTVGRSQVSLMHHSRDATMKLLLALADSQKVETVAMPYADRFSCCISTQVGCPVRCAFCATGISGYTRNLTTGEIVDQVLTVQEVAREPHFRGTPFSREDQDGGDTRLILRQAQDRPSAPSSRRKGEVAANSQRRISHVVFMGMGEPLLNYAATLKAVQLLNAELGIGMRHLTVSTVGFVPGIRQLAKERLQLTLAVSLHAPNDQLRQQLIPTMSRWTVAEVLDACREYIQKTGRRVTFEYCLLNQVNDGLTEARELTDRLRGLNCHVNLIPYNPVAGLDFQAPPLMRVRAFRQVLEEASIPVTQRVQRGADIDAACGQLRRADMSSLMVRQAHHQRTLAVS